MTELSLLLKQFLQILADEIISKVPSVSHETAQAIKVNVTEETTDPLHIVTKGELTGPKYVRVLEDGRGPTKTTTKGSPTLQERIYEWIKARSITPRIKANQKKAITQESLSWAMAIKIHNEGNKLFRSGGKSGVISTTITDDRIDAFIKVFTEKSSRYLLNNLLKQVNK